MLDSMWRTHLKLEDPGFIDVSRKLRNTPEQVKRRKEKEEQLQRDRDELLKIKQKFDRLSLEYNTLTEEARAYIVQYMMGKIPAMQRMCQRIKVFAFSNMCLAIQTSMEIPAKGDPLREILSFFRETFVGTYVAVVQAYEPQNGAWPNKTNPK